MKKPRILMRFAAWTFLICVLHTPAHAAFDAFLKIEGVDGESKDDKHKDQIEILSYSWGASSVIDTTTGAGKFVGSDFQIIKTLDLSSAKLADACAKGTHIPTATITLRKSGGERIIFVRYIFQDILITGYQIASSGGEDRPMESLSLNFAKVGVEYFTISPLGSIAARDAFTWDFILNGVGTITFPPSIDEDDDSLPDEWERAFQLDPTKDDADDDKDGDGATNEDEYIAGTDPTAADKVFKASLNFTPGARTAALTFTSAPGRSYQILIGLNLEDPFQPYMTIPSSGEGTTTINLPAGSVNQFFRVEVVP